MAADVPLAYMPRALVPDRHDLTFGEEEDQVFQPVNRPAGSKLYLLLDNQGDFSTGPGIALRILLITAVITSCGVFLISTFPQFYSNEPAMLFYIDTICIIVFVIDIGTRIVLYPGRRAQFFKSFLNIMDMGAILPYFIDIGLMLRRGGDPNSTVRVLRMLRIARIFKLARFSKTLRIVGDVVTESLPSFVLLGSFLIIETIFFASVIYFAEQLACTFDKSTLQWKYKDGTVSDFQHVHGTFWYVIQTITTCGYGDIVSRTVQGKILTFACLVVGLITIALPVFIVAEKFTAVYNRYNPNRDSGTVELVSTHVNVAIPQTMRQKVNSLWNLEGPHAGRHWAIASRAFNFLIFVFVCLAVLNICLQSLPRVVADPDGVFAKRLNYLDWLIVAIFLLEIIAHAICTPFLREFFKEVQTWIDIVSILPSVVDVILTLTNTDSSSLAGFIALRIVRLLRLLRILKFAKFNEHLEIVMHTIKISKDAFSLITVGVVLLGIVWASIIYLAELSGSTFVNGKWVRADGQISPFQSVIHALWWSINSMIPVGYGDEVPISGVGKVAGSFTMISGIVFLPFPLILFSRHYVSSLELFGKLDKLLSVSDMLPDKAVVVLVRWRSRQIRVFKIAGTPSVWQWKDELSRRAMSELTTQPVAQAKVPYDVNTMEWGFRYQPLLLWLTDEHTGELRYTLHERTLAPYYDMELTLLLDHDEASARVRTMLGELYSTEFMPSQVGSRRAAGISIIKPDFFNKCDEEITLLHPRYIAGEVEVKVHLLFNKYGTASWIAGALRVVSVPVHCSFQLKRVYFQVNGKQFQTTTVWSALKALAPNQTRKYIHPIHLRQLCTGIHEQFNRLAGEYCEGSLDDSAYNAILGLCPVASTYKFVYSHQWSATYRGDELLPTKLSMLLNQIFTYDTDGLRFNLDDSSTVIAGIPIFPKGAPKQQYYSPQEVEKLLESLHITARAQNGEIKVMSSDVVEFDAVSIARTTGTIFSTHAVAFDDTFSSEVLPWG